MARPSTLAVLMLMTNSNLVGCITGSSEGLAPWRIRLATTPTKPPAVGNSRLARLCGGERPGEGGAPPTPSSNQTGGGAEGAPPPIAGRGPPARGEARTAPPPAPD